MGVLDSVEWIAASDPSRTLETIASFGDQAAAAAEAADAVRLPGADGVDAILFCGMGGSAVAGDVIAASARETSQVPVVVHRTYGVPSFCGPRTLVIASSYSGATEETLDAARAARAAGARGVAITHGGPLADEAASWGWDVVTLGPVVWPRYALGWLVGAPVAALGRAGYLRLARGWPQALASAGRKGAARWGPSAPTADNVAKALAHELVGAFPVIWGGDGVSGAAAVRFKSDLQENAKTYAHAAVLPEADHNEIVGWAREGRQGRAPGRRILICLREPDEDRRIASRFRETVAECAGSFDLTWEHTASGADAVARFFDHALLAGYVSTYLALLRGVDPAPVDSISRLKAALASTPGG